MKTFFIVLFVFLYSFSGLYAQPSGRPSALELHAYSSKKNEQIVWYKRYTVSFNKKYRIPNWVAWELTYDHTQGTQNRKDMSFYKDARISQCPTTDEYKTDKPANHYDKICRGHMCPALDNKWDAEAYKESFYLTNICPQKEGLNNGKWKSLEERCQNTWAKDYGKIYIVCGPIEPKRKKYLGDTGILIPELFFKAILREVKVNDKIHYEAIGYILSQENRWYNNKFYTVNEIEAMTGLDLFHNLDDRIEEKVEDVVHEDKWQNPYI